MKTLLTITAFAAFTAFSQAQDGQVTINQDNKIVELLEIYKTATNNANYYRIQVGFGSYAKAQRIKSNVEIDFPDLVSKIDFDSPTYRVRLGRFKSKLVAERKFKEVRKKYPEAILLKPKKSTK
ncbi:SPOR domain-containing protein [uncultured Maribacter sp.]|uniref:SPOR domain-containing protein n=1 Tax=uncultured Maribacter sp. TaxID=431308 RepID=UPI00260A4004|nr:SPOR domain-containing protein [uncultured Maribacter sp.]